MIYKSAKSVREGTLVVDADDVFADEHFDSVFDAPMVQVVGPRTLIRDVRLTSTWGAGTDNHGVDVLAPYQQDVRIANATVMGPGGDGFRLRKPSVGMGPQLSNCRSVMHIYGAGFRVESEYVILTNCQSYGGSIGYYLDAGNVNLTGCQAHSNTSGLVIRGENGNDGHPCITGGQFNHSTDKALDIDPLLNGATLTGCHFYYGKIRIAGSPQKKGLIHFVGATIDVTELDLRGALVRFDACTWPMANANTFIMDADTVLQFPDTNRKLDGTVMTP